MTALKIQGPWVMVSVERDGKVIRGWIYGRKYLERVTGAMARPDRRKPELRPGDNRATGEKPPSAEVPRHLIVDEDTYDAPIKTQLVIHALVTQDPTESNVQALLWKLYEDAARRSGFKHHGGRPTHVFIYAYSSDEHFKSGAGQWIGMLSRIGAGAEPEVNIKRQVIAQLRQRPVEKFGLSEARRKEVFHLIVQAEDRANKEAQARYPLEPAQHLQVGQSVTLAESTPLMPELDPVDPMAALARVRHLPVGARIKVTKVVRKKVAPWYAVQASAPSGAPIGRGWINSIALMGQLKIDVKDQLRRQLEMDDQLTAQYKRQIARQYGLTQDQLVEISVEALRKNWPMPKE